MQTKARSFLGILIALASIAAGARGAQALNPRGITPTNGCMIYTSTDVPHDIPDGSGIGSDAVPGPPVNSVLHVPDSVVIGDINVLNLQATHPFAQDLEFHLRSPANTDVLLLQGKCGDNDNFNLSLDDSAALTLESPNSCNDGQSHQPQQPLSAFNGQNASGQWTLVVARQRRRRRRHPHRLELADLCATATTWLHDLHVDRRAECHPRRQRASAAGRRPRGRP